MKNRIYYHQHLSIQSQIKQPGLIKTAKITCIATLIQLVGNACISKVSGKRLPRDVNDLTKIRHTNTE